MVGPIQRPFEIAGTIEANVLLMGAPAMMEGVGALARLPAMRITAAAIGTPYGAAIQESSQAAASLASDVSNGAELFRGGMFGRSAAAEGQFWAAESPLSSGFANRMGAATLNGGTPDFVIGGTLRPGAGFITRSAPGFGANAGGGLETVTNPFAVRLNFFHMP